MGKWECESNEVVKLKVVKSFFLYPTKVACWSAKVVMTVSGGTKTLGPQLWPKPSAAKARTDDSTPASQAMTNEYL